MLVHDYNKAPLYLALCGAGGTGKGTLSKIIAEEYKIHFLPSRIQDIGMLYFPKTKNYKEIAQSITDKIAFQYAIVTAQVEKELLLRENGFSYVTERTLIDYYAYMSKFEQDNKDILTKEHKQSIQNYYAYIIRSFDELPYKHIFYLPFNDFKNTQADLSLNRWKDRQITNDSTNSIMDSLIRSIAQYFKDKCGVSICLIHGSLEDRMEQIETAV